MCTLRRLCEEYLTSYKVFRSADSSIASKLVPCRLHHQYPKALWSALTDGRADVYGIRIAWLAWLATRPIYFL